MNRLQPTEFYLLSLVARTNPNPYCFDKCIKTDQITNQLSREQQRCLGNCVQKYRQASRLITN